MTLHDYHPILGKVSLLVLLSSRWLLCCGELLIHRQLLTSHKNKRKNGITWRKEEEKKVMIWLEITEKNAKNRLF